MALYPCSRYIKTGISGEKKRTEMEGARIDGMKLTCVGYPVSEEATEKLCQDIEKFRRKQECQKIL